MAKLDSYNGSIEAIDGFKPKNNGGFPLIEAHDVLVGEDDERLDEVLEGLESGGASLLEKGGAEGAMQSKDFHVNDFSYNGTTYTGFDVEGAKATGVNAIAIGGRRPDKAAQNKGDADGEYNTEAKGVQSVAIGGGSRALGHWGASIGKDNTAYASCAVAIGGNCVAGAETQKAEDGVHINPAVAIGNACTASGYSAVALGQEATASSNNAVAIGKKAQATNESAVAIGDECAASGKYTFATNKGTKATNYYAVAMGVNTTASGQASMAGGYSTQATKDRSFAMGYGCVSQNADAFAMGYSCKTSRDRQSVVGVANKDNGDALFIVGNGKISSSSTTRSNAFEVMADGRAKVYGAPTEPEDVVRKQDLDDIGGGGSGMTDAQKALLLLLLDLHNLTTTQTTTETFTLSFGVSVSNPHTGTAPFTPPFGEAKYWKLTNITCVDTSDSDYKPVAEITDASAWTYKVYTKTAVTLPAPTVKITCTLEYTL